MGIVIRQSLKATGVTYLGVVIGTLNQMVVALYFLETQEIGLTRSLLSFSLLLYGIFTFGGPAIADRFFSHFRNEELKHNGFLTFLLGYAAFYFVVFIAVFLAAKPWFTDFYEDQSPELVRYYYLLIWLTGFNLLQGILEAYCRNLQRIAIPAFLREVGLKLANMAVILLYGFKLVTLDQFVQLFVFSNAFVGIGLLIYLRYMGKLYLAPISWKLVNPVIGEMMRFGFVASIGAIGTTLCTYLDILLIGSYKGQSWAGIFATATLIASLIEIPKKSLTQIAIPLVAQSLREKKYETVQQMHQKVALHQLLAGLFLFIGIWSNIDDLFKILPKGAEFASGTTVVFLFLITRLLDMAGGMSSEIMGYSQYYRVSTVFVLILGGLTIWTNHLLIPRFGINGSAMATTITILIYSTMRAAFVYWKFKILPFTQQTLGAFGIGLVTYLITWAIPDFGESFLSQVINIALRGTVTTVVFASLVVGLRISPEINGIVDNVIKKVRKTNP
ncbi:hypothetical protein BWI96_16165 [Siphonobacter sp. SORGH_AS_0500]|uniref:polysaccharide biosynthesis C-terminal domain-containing protein n=1 Tax=Siphonobacter sp. SORGH_AS_0500 TaxID=1864824 RepID=UPI000CBA5638|nr:oligosaccharide flippase family protein [Siphonobacter sp. SORGH_AS_0500]PKK35633.1 hypothetical protein BWI96_16165 [Siphonobacter sp. SORGH_AS_0500]